MYRQVVAPFFFAALIQVSPLRAQDAMSGMDWLELAALSHQNSLDRLPSGTVRVVKRRTLHSHEGGALIQDITDHYSSSFQGSLFHSVQMSREVATDFQEDQRGFAIDRIQVLHDGEFTYVYREERYEGRKTPVRIARKYPELDMAQHVDYDLHPFEVTRHFLNIPFVQYVTEALPKLAPQVGTSAMELEGRSLVKVELDFGKQTLEFRIDPALDNHVVTVIVYDDDTGVIKEKIDWGYDRVQGVVAPTSLHSVEDHSRGTYTTTLQFGPYDFSTTFNDARFDVSALDLKVGTRFIEEFKEKPLEVSHVGNFDSADLEDMAQELDRIVAEVAAMALSPAGSSDSLLAVNDSPGGGASLVDQADVLAPQHDNGSETSRKLLSLSLAFIVVLAGFGLALAWKRKRRMGKARQ